MSLTTTCLYIYEYIYIYKQQKCADSKTNKITSSELHTIKLSQMIWIAPANEVWLMTTVNSPTVTISGGGGGP